MRSRRRQEHPLVVEFVGAPGSGKSTLLATVIEAAESEGLCAYTAIEASRLFATRTVVGRAILHLVPRARRRAALWATFSLFSALATVPFIATHPRLAAHLIRTQMGRPAAANARSRRVVFWYLRLMGTYRFLLRKGGSGELIAFDEGFLHRSVQLHASQVELPTAGEIEAYVGCLPRPDLVVHLRSGVEVCEQRVVDRGVWRRFQGQRRDQVSAFVASAHHAAELAASAARTRQWPLVEISTDGMDLHASRSKLRSRVTAAVARLRDGHGCQEVVERSDGGFDGRLYSFYLPQPGRAKEIIASRLAPPTVGGETVRCVLEAYGLALTGQPRNLPLGWRNRNVVVTTELGPMVLKQYPDRWTDSSIAHEHSILRHLASVAFPAPRLRTAPSGETAVVLDGARFALFDFERGKNLAGCLLPRAARDGIVQLSGRLLGRLHRALDGFSPDALHHLDGRDSHKRLSSVYVQLLTQLMNQQPATNGDHRWPWLAQNARGIGARITRLEDELQGALLPTSVIHGDFGVHNISFQRDGNAVVHDFELARADWQVADVAIALSRLDPVERGTFLRGYGEVRPITLDERRLLSKVWELHRLCGAVRSWNNFVLHGGPGRLATAQSRVIEAERIAREGVAAWL